MITVSLFKEGSSQRGRADYEIEVETVPAVGDTILLEFSKTIGFIVLYRAQVVDFDENLKQVGTPRVILEVKTI